MISNSVSVLSVLCGGRDDEGEGVSHWNRHMWTRHVWRIGRRWHDRVSNSSGEKCGENEGGGC